MIKAIIFDFHGVLGTKKQNFVISKLAQDLDNQIGMVTSDDEFKRNTISKYNLTENDFESLLTEIVDRYEKFHGLWDVLPELKKKYKLAIINNGTYLTIPAFKKHFPIDENFDFFISSAIEGVKKPDVKIFLLTAQRLGVKPEECLFMDDVQENVDGAIRSGMKAFHWKGSTIGLQKLKAILEMQGS